MRRIDPPHRVIKFVESLLNQSPGVTLRLPPLILASGHEAAERDGDYGDEYD